MQADEMSHQAMGYDRTSIMFSPDGRLLQVEYAKKTAKQGSTVVGVVYKDGALILADKRITERLIIPESVEKVFQIDEHIGASTSGILGDGRVLVERAQVIAQQHRVTYDTPITTETLVKEISNLKQLYTQVGGARPFGVSIIFIGMGERPHVFVTDPTGIFVEYKATAIGEGDAVVKEMFEKQYKENMSFEDAARFAMSALKKALDKDFDPARIDGAYIPKDTKRFTRFTREEIAKFAR